MPLAETFKFRLDTEDLRQLEEIARRLQRSRGDALRWLIRTAHREMEAGREPRPAPGPRPALGSLDRRAAGPRKVRLGAWDARLADAPVDEGLPDDWGDPEEPPTTPAWADWRTLMLTLAADEKRALVGLAERRRCTPEALGARLLRLVLAELGALERDGHGQRTR